MATKKIQTPLQEAIKAYVAVANITLKLDHAEEVLNRKVLGLNTKDTEAYVKATTAYSARHAANIERLEKMLAENVTNIPVEQIID